jgi:hypothetical protein
MIFRNLDVYTIRSDISCVLCRMRCRSPLHVSEAHYFAARPDHCWLVIRQEGRQPDFVLIYRSKESFCLSSHGSYGRRDAIYQKLLQKSVQSQ